MGISHSLVFFFSLNSRPLAALAWPFSFFLSFNFSHLAAHEGRHRVAVQVRRRLAPRPAGVAARYGHAGVHVFFLQVQNPKDQIQVRQGHRLKARAWGVSFIHDEAMGDRLQRGESGESRSFSTHFF